MIIQIPIEIYENGDYKIFEDRTFMKLEPCTELPPISTSNRDSVLDVLTNMLLPQERIKWASSYSKDDEDDDDHNHEDFEEDDADTKAEEEEEETDSGEEETQEERQEETEKDPELRVYANEIKPKKKTSSAIMTFKKLNHRHLKDHFTRKSRNPWFPGRPSFHEGI